MGRCSSRRGRNGGACGLLARLLAGEMPPEIEEVFTAHAIALFPAGTTAWPEIPPAPPLGQTLDTFWTAGKARVRIEPNALTVLASDTPLRQIDTDLELDGMSVATLLVPAYAAMSDATRRRLAGDAADPEMLTDVKPGSPPGKPRSAPLRAR